MPENPPDISHAYSPDGAYVVAQHLGWRSGGIAFGLVTLFATACALTLVYTLTGLQEVIYASVFALCVLYLPTLITPPLTRSYWRTVRARHENAVREAQQKLEELDAAPVLEPKHVSLYALSALATASFPGKTATAADAVRIDIAALDRLFLKHDLKRPRAILYDVRAALAEPPGDAFHEAERIRLPAPRPLMLLPWLALSGLAWRVWSYSYSDESQGVAMGALLVAGITMMQAFHIQDVWHMSDWRLAPGRIGRCWIGSSIEAASDTHIMHVYRHFDGAMHLMFVNNEGVTLAVNAGRRTGQLYRKIWREWMYEGTPAPPLVEK